MTFDATWFEQVWSIEGIEELDVLEVEGVPVEMPLPGKTGVKLKHRQWQRRVLDDLMPDSPNADAPERIPLRILRHLTTPEKPAKKYGEALGEGTPFAPLAPIFLFATRRKQFKVPVAFHVLSTKASDSTIRSGSYTEHTFLLLMRDEAGVIDEELLAAFIDQFRAAPESLDLAHRTVLEQLEPGWDRTRNIFNLTDSEEVRPLVPAAGELLRRDIRTLLSADLPSADFFRYTNQLLALHLGLYQPRIAFHLNPAMDLLLAELATPGSAETAAVEAIEEGLDPRYRFEGRLTVRAPSGGQRPVRAGSRVRRDFQAMEEQLAELHFNLMLLYRVRELARGYLRARGYDEGMIPSTVARPSQLIRRLQDDPEFRNFLLRATEALTVRFALDQLSKEYQDRCRDESASMPTGLHALKSAYVRYNLENARNIWNNRAYKQGAQITRSLLSQGEMGLVQSRRGIGTYFEIGAGMLPLLLLLIVGVDREKVTVSSFWDGLARYGLRLDEDERGRLLARLKAMGLYERFSDAGEASYVRGLITPELKEAM